VRRILVTFGFRQEGLSFERSLTRRIAKSRLLLGSLGSREIAVYCLGAGVRDEDQFMRSVADFRPGLVINSGFAGAVRTLLEPGDFVLGENFSSPELMNRLKTNRVFESRGRIVCVDNVADAATKARINGEGNVIAVDMESVRVAEICRKLSVSLVTARMISDRHDEGIPGIFLGKGIREIRDIFNAIGFASRMIVLRRRLADRLSELIRALP
jgi:adenosylhomocysteine nucleosidase